MTRGDVDNQIDAQNNIASTTIFFWFTSKLCQKQWSTKQSKQNGIVNFSSCQQTHTQRMAHLQAHNHTCNQTILGSYPQYFYQFFQEPARYAYAHKGCPCLSNCKQCAPPGTITNNPLGKTISLVAAYDHPSLQHLPCRHLLTVRRTVHFWSAYMQ